MSGTVTANELRQVEKGLYDHVAGVERAIEARMQSNVQRIMDVRDLAQKNAADHQRHDAVCAERYQRISDRGDATNAKLATIEKTVDHLATIFPRIAWGVACTAVLLVIDIVKGVLVP